MFLKEKTIGSTVCTSLLCRNYYNQAFLFIGAFGIIIYTSFEHSISAVPILTEVKFWLGIGLLVILTLSFINQFVKKIISGFLVKLPFILAPSIFMTLYLKNLEPYYTFFFLMMFTIMAFLFKSKRTFGLYLILYSIGMALVLFLVKDNILHKAMVGYYYIGLAAIVWVVNISFIWSQDRLRNELNRVERLNYLNSHRLRAHVARIIGLNHLTKIGDLDAKDMIDNEINLMELELRKMQQVISQTPTIKTQKLGFLRRLSIFIFRTKKDTNVLNVGFVLFEVLLLINIGMRYNLF